MRSCGGCTLCCVIPAVPELAKPINETCVFCNNKGCAIYPSRPRSCRAFTCAWLAGEMPRWMKPDKVHVMIEPMAGFRTVLALAEPGYEGRWRTAAVDRVLKEEYQAKGIAVVASDQMALIPEGRTAAEVMGEVRRFASSSGVG